MKINNQHLLIFDIDGTLTNSGGLTRIAMDRTALTLYNVKNATKGIMPAGRTDIYIFQEIVKNNNLKFKNINQEFENFIDEYVALLEQLLFESPLPRTLDGVEQLLQSLECRSDVCLALGTGNIKKSAYLKLKRTEVNHYFPTGGFGDISDNRNVIIKAAKTNAENYYQKSFPNENVWVIGDTTFDVMCAKNNNFNSIAVASGVFSIEELQHSQPNAALENLTNIKSFFNIIGIG